jgi:hypothetical protein
MKYITTFLITLLFLTSCIDQNTSGIEGDWIGYDRTFVLGKDTVVDNFHLILSINQDSIRVINYKYIVDGNRDSLSVFSYLLINDSLIVYPGNGSLDTLKVDFLNATTLILSTSENKYKYARLFKSNKKTKETELTGKMFTISDSIQIIDTIEFLDNSTSLSYNKKLERQNWLHQWRLRDYLGNELLIIDSPEIPVFSLNTIDSKCFILKREPNGLIEYNLEGIEFQKKLISNMLFGEWAGKSNIPEKTVFFKFQTDSAQMNEFTGGEILTGTYVLNLSGTKMFCFHEYANELITYEIKGLRNDSLFLNRLTPIKDSFVLTRIK